MSRPRTLFQKIWDDHLVRPEGDDYLERRALRRGMPLSEVTAPAVPRPRP